MVTISRALERVRPWVRDDQPYDLNRTRDGYRTDCSGFASCAWANWRPGASTYRYNPRLATHAEPTFEIARSALRPADGLIDNGGKRHHMAIVVDPTDLRRTRVWHESGQANDTEDDIVDLIGSSYWSRFVPIRCRLVVPDAPPPPAVDLGAIDAIYRSGLERCTVDPLHVGDREQLVAIAADKLRSLGFVFEQKVGDTQVDDFLRYSVSMVRAVQRFQRRHGLRDTGRIGRWTWRLLFTAPLPPP